MNQKDLFLYLSTDNAFHLTIRNDQSEWGIRQIHGMAYVKSLFSNSSDVCLPNLLWPLTSSSFPIFSSAIETQTPTRISETYYLSHSCPNYLQRCCNLVWVTWGSATVKIIACLRFHFGILISHFKCELCRVHFNLLLFLSELI